MLDRTAADPSDTVEHLLRGEQARRLLDALPERERRILELRFGVYNDPQSLEAIGKKIGLTRSVSGSSSAKRLPGPAPARDRGVAGKPPPATCQPRPPQRGEELLGAVSREVGKHPREHVPACRRTALPRKPEPATPNRRGGACEHDLAVSPGIETGPAPIYLMVQR